MMTRLQLVQQILVKKSKIHILLQINPRSMLIFFTPHLCRDIVLTSSVCLSVCYHFHSRNTQLEFWYGGQVERYLQVKLEGQRSESPGQKALLGISMHCLFGHLDAFMYLARKRLRNIMRGSTTWGVPLPV